MEGAVGWYAGLHKFYRILVLAAAGVGALGVGAGMATGNGAIFAIGLAWLLGGPAVVSVASRLDE
ncbi:hypothetical protein [Halovenus salina]|uniref:Uncharacterized protein n=1 Tax=Halovenus salina TaxID=1510225 RepID=A0ABD5W3G1_9EURY|nr:hypothetical protein [Halovenus salina]